MRKLAEKKEPRRFKDSPLFQITGTDTGTDRGTSTSKDNGNSTGTDRGTGTSKDSDMDRGTGRSTSMDRDNSTSNGSITLTKKTSNQKNVKLSVYVRPEQLRQLNDLQEESGRDKSELTRIALDLLLEQVKIK